MISFNVGGFPDIIEHHKNGSLVEPFSIEDFVDEVEGWLFGKLAVDFDTRICIPGLRFTLKMSPLLIKQFTNKQLHNSIDPYE